MSRRAEIICACCLLLAAAGCRHGRPAHLRLDGLGAGTDGSSPVSLAVRDGRLVIRGDDFEIRVSPWDVGAPFAGGEGHTLTVRIEYRPDGPSAVLELRDRGGTAILVGYRARQNASVLPGYRLHPGSVLAYPAENGRCWTQVSLERPDGARTPVVPGRAVTLAAEGRRWTLVVTGASIPAPGGATPDLAGEEPGFIADYVVWSRPR
jgi:hypothetical protein